MLHELWCTFHVCGVGVVMSEMVEGRRRWKDEEGMWWEEERSGGREGEEMEGEVEAGEVQICCTNVYLIRKPNFADNVWYLMFKFSEVFDVGSERRLR